ncbi:TIGR01777 family oxidoreductase [bacterium]|nr:TIGR01777 family oxidoreductase [bacterium]
MKREWKVAITGASGFVGSFLQAFLQDKGCLIFPVGRKELADSKLLESILEKVDVVINLAGENIGKGYWSKKKKQKIYESRIASTKVVVDALNRKGMGEKVLISASAVGFYGEVSKASQESEVAGKDFLATVCKDWEEAAKGYKQGRVVITRFGVVLSKDGGFLMKMIALARYLLGGKIGTGTQHMSFIALEDLAGIIFLCMENSSLSGAINVVMPSTITNKEFTKQLSYYVRRPLILAMPKWVVLFVFGEKGKALLLADQEVYPKKLIDAGYKFIHPTLESIFTGVVG